MFSSIENVLITVKAYPNPSKKYQETVCIAGIVPDKGWIRLYPIKYRQTPFRLRFKKYELLRLKIEKHSRDKRPESYRPDIGSIERVGYFDTRTDKNWTKRKKIVMKFIDDSMCDILEQQRLTNKSLGLFKPKEIFDFVIEEKNPKWYTVQKNVYNQMSIFENSLKPLEEIPFSFKYRYSCHNVKCPGHNQTIIDWEVFALYRNLKKQLGNDKEIIKNKIKNKFLEQMFSINRDTYFYTGNVAKHPRSFILLGVFWPPK